MKLYGSFLIRCWMHSGENQLQAIVFDVEHVQGGERLRFQNPDEAWQWMIQILHTGGEEASKAVEPEDEKLNTNQHS